MARKITPEELVEKGVVSAPDKLTGNPSENKKIFDRLVAEVVAPALNECVDAMENLENAQAEVEEKELQRQQAEKERAEAEEARVDSTNGIVAQATRQAIAAARSALMAAISASKARLYLDGGEGSWTYTDNEGNEVSESCSVPNGVKYYAENAKAEAESAKAGAEFVRGKAREVNDALTYTQLAAGSAQTNADDAARSKAAAEAAAEMAKQVLQDATSGSADRLQALEKNVADLMYQAVDITAFSNDFTTVEMGSTVTDVALTWEINKVPVTLLLDGEEIEPTLTGKTLTGLNITGKKTWTLVATDEREATDSKTTSITFVNAAYYGAAAAPESLDSDFLLSLTKKLTDTRKRTITVDAAAGQHIWYAVPVRLGACTFKVGGFEGGFDLVATVDFTNAYGYTEPYYIYRSGQSGLGETTVEVT